METKEEILRLRRKHIGKNLSISYKNPLLIVKGEAQYLIDEKGERYLDCVNNVAHVGHCHPRVVKAAQDQLALLNTNTRYLHPSLVNYAQQLCATFPAPLSVCFFTCSGSEANDLAQRLARAYTKARDVVVVDYAYHGALLSTVEISPYKFKGKGGFPCPEHVHVVEAPDTFRGRFRASDPQAGLKYAALVEEKLEELKQNGRKVAAFFCESVIGCAGQIVLPDGYLSAVYRAVRQHGGVCVADEVQTGFGRAGSAFWAFQTQGPDVVPDIVTLGKPIGNGFPMAAVVTTPAIADAFFNGMEYFNTFGGNPVSMAVGLAVLQVIQDEQLQQHSLRVGNHLLQRLQQLQQIHPLIGDVRGLGLFIGIELVRDRTTLEPATEEAAFLVNALKERYRILLSTDGPHENVLKFKPPLCFSQENADELVTAIDVVLKEMSERTPISSKL